MTSPEDRLAAALAGARPAKLCWYCKLVGDEREFLDHVRAMWAEGRKVPAPLVRSVLDEDFDVVSSVDSINKLRRKEYQCHE